MLCGAKQLLFSLFSLFSLRWKKSRRGTERREAIEERIMKRTKRKSR